MLSIFIQAMAAVLCCAQVTKIHCQGWSNYTFCSYNTCSGQSTGHLQAVHLLGRLSATHSVLLYCSCADALGLSAGRALNALSSNMYHKLFLNVAHTGPLKSGIKLSSSSHTLSPRTLMLLAHKRALHAVTSVCAS